MLSQRTPEEEALRNKLVDAYETVELHKNMLDQTSQEMEEQKRALLVARDAAFVKDYVFNIQALALIFAGFKLYQEDYVAATLFFLATTLSLQSVTAILKDKRFHLHGDQGIQNDIAASIAADSQRSALAQVGNAIISGGQRMNQYGSLFAYNCKEKIEQKIYGETAPAVKNKKLM